MRLEQRKSRTDRIGQLAVAIDRRSEPTLPNPVEDEVHSSLSFRLQQIRVIFGTIPDTPAQTSRLETAATAELGVLLSR